MTPRDRWASVLGGAGAGAFGGLFGVGGGILLVPVITGMLGRTQHEAHGTSLAAIGATALAGVIVYGLGGHVDWITALVAGTSSLLTARIGARLASRTSTRTLKLAFSIMLVLVAARLLWRVPAGHALLEQMRLPARIAFDLAVGASVGFLAGVMGVGGGVIAVPAFTLLLGMSQQLAQGTSLALILIAAPAGAIEHARHGNVVGNVALWLAIGAVAGGLMTAALVQSAPGPLLTRGFAIFLLANAIPMGYRALRAPGVPAEGTRRPGL